MVPAAITENEWLDEICHPVLERAIKFIETEVPLPARVHDSGIIFEMEDVMRFLQSRTSGHSCGIHFVHSTDEYGHSLCFRC